MLYTTAQLQKMYTNYAFIDTDGTARAQARCSGNAEDEALPQDGYYEQIHSQVTRSYESGNWYKLVFKPYNKAYNENRDRMTVKAIDICRRCFVHKKTKRIDMDFRSDYIVLSREIQDCTKVHVNALVHSENDLSLLHGTTHAGKYKVYCELLVGGTTSRRSWLNYMFKERTKRRMLKYLDYLITDRATQS